MPTPESLVQCIIDSLGGDNVLIGTEGLTNGRPKRKRNKRAKSVQIPLDVLIPAGEATELKFGKNADLWDTTEETYCKDLCRPVCETLSEGQFRIQYVDYRKKETHRKRKEKQGKDPFFSKEYKEHLKTPEHHLMVRILIAQADGRCRGCNQPAIEGHHRAYKPETWGAPEELNDMVAVCRKCHKVLDRRRQSEMLTE